MPTQFVDSETGDEIRTVTSGRKKGVTFVSDRVAKKVAAKAERRKAPRKKK